TPEVTMHDALPTTGLIAYRKAMEAAGIAISIVLRVPAPLRSVADQLVRAASSVPANLAEGHGRSGRDRLQHWRIAYGSAKEADAQLRLLLAAGVLEAAASRRALALLDEVRAMTWRLLYP
ncbi:MAG: four helix bundle protein, partial [Thermoanaerobaculales bacterium]|nr:four helix bundle protein [Thermoanaerobaculales bacterium]